MGAESMMREEESAADSACKTITLHLMMAFKIVRDTDLMRLNDSNREHFSCQKLLKNAESIECEPRATMLTR